MGRTSAPHARRFDEARAVDAPVDPEDGGGMRRGRPKVLAGRLICLMIGHGYTGQRMYGEREAQHSLCKRCGHKRYKPPGDFLSGADPQGAGGGIGGGV